ncbi:MAG: DUF4124 domain-containing protein [Gammaproteobacteria bacterium]
MFKGIIIVLLATLITGTALADGTIYKWVDKNGNVHYSTVPQSPNAQPLNIVNTATNHAPPASTAPSAASTSSADQALTTVMPADSATCKSARETLGKYLDASYLYTMDKNGQKQQLPKDQQDQAIAQAKNTVTQACSPQESPP